MKARLTLLCVLQSLFLSNGQSVGDIVHSRSSENCNNLQSGTIVNNGQNVPLYICRPDPVQGRCEHCTHASSVDACWTLNTTYCYGIDDIPRKVENWGFNPAGEWTQNFDEKGNYVTSVICTDTYGAHCFTETPFTSISPQPPQPSPLAVGIAVLTALSGFHGRV